MTGHGQVEPPAVMGTPSLESWVTFDDDDGGDGNQPISVSGQSQYLDRLGVPAIPPYHMHTLVPRSTRQFV